MLHISRVIVTEGKYDKIRLESVTDAPVITLDGFAVFSDREKIACLRRLAEERGIIVLTDSDAAGFKLRAFVNGCISGGSVQNAYIPDIYGKERRKFRPSKEGKIGVEGIDSPALEKILSGYANDSEPQAPWLKKSDMYADGLNGRTNSSEMRRRFAAEAGLPERIGSNSLLEFINALMTEKEYRDILSRICRP